LCFFQDWDNIIDARFETLEVIKLGPEVGRNIPFVGFVRCPRLRSLKLTCHLDGWISLAGCNNLESLEISMPDAEEPNNHRRHSSEEPETNFIPENIGKYSGEHFSRVHIYLNILVKT